MELYKNLNQNSGITAYMIGEDYIVVQFKAGRETRYKYTNISAGSSVIRELKKLAIQGYGLNSYISKNKVPYSTKS